MGDGGGGLGLVEGSLPATLEKYYFPEKNPDGPDSFCTKNEMVMIHDDGRCLSHFYYLPGIVKCFTNIMFDSHKNSRDYCH